MIKRNTVRETDENSDWLQAGGGVLIVHTENCVFEIN